MIACPGFIDNLAGQVELQIGECPDPEIRDIEFQVNRHTDDMI